MSYIQEQYANNAVTFITGDVGMGDTTITVDSSALTAGFPVPNFRVLIDNEIMLVTAIDNTGLIWTVTRAVEPNGGIQTASSHSAMAVVTHILSAASIQLAKGPQVSPSGAQGLNQGRGVPLNSGTTSTGGIGTTAYTYGDLVRALKIGNQIPM